MKPKAQVSQFSRWNLYWVGYDGEEDCFVIARNSRSAGCYDASCCGYDSQDNIVVRVTAVPEATARNIFRRPADDGYVGARVRFADDFAVEKLGGSRRNLESRTETRFGDVVFTTNAAKTVPPRYIGRTYVKKLTSSQLYTDLGDEDIYSEDQNNLMTLLGICVARCQEIEDLIASSFILGAAHPGKNKYKTINEMSQGWKKKTFGQMLKAIDHSYIVDAEMRGALGKFLEMRNELVHGITTSDRYNLSSDWGQREMLAFLAWFEFLSRAVRKAFRASYYASIDFGNQHLLPSGAKPVRLSRAQQRQVDIFVHFFRPRDEV